jgi:serine/threonine-protein kinase
VERYELLLPIGSGGSATVYLARTPLIDGLFREVAIKLMHPKLDADEGQFASELLDEARVVAAIRHPNVVSILEVGDSPEGVYLVMDYVRGDTLSGLIRQLLEKQEQLPLPVVARILADALLGLHAAHELVDEQSKSLGLVHRDFSPQNLLVGVDGVTRLTDFGIAKVTGRVSGTASGIVKGKVGYMSPEQALGERLDRRSDLWAAGVVCWEMLAQRRLFEGEDASVLLSIVSKDPPDVRSARPDCPEACAQVIARSLSRDRALRYDTALELRDALLRAFRTTVGVAENDEVARLVSRVVEPRLAERAQQARAVEALRSGLRQSNVPAPQSRTLTHPSLRTWGAAAGVLALGVALAFSFGPQQTSPSETRVSIASSHVLGDPPRPTTSASTRQDVGRPTQLLHFTSAVPISGLVVGGKSIYLPAPSTSIEVQLPADVTFPVSVQARTGDGRSVRSELAPGQLELALSFPAPKASGRAPRRGQPGPRRSSDVGLQELAPPPYR